METILKDWDNITSFWKVLLFPLYKYGVGIVVTGVRGRRGDVVVWLPPKRGGAAGANDRSASARTDKASELNGRLPRLSAPLSTTKTKQMLMKI